MKKTILSLLCVLALCLGLLPTAALAAGEDAPNVLYVGATNIGTNDNAAYWTSEDGGTTWNSQQTQPEGDSYIYYDGQGTLELHNVTIQGQYDNSNVFGAGIYALCGTNQSVSLTIQLTGNNTITGDFGIYVDAQQGGTLGANASLSITGDGSLTVTGTTSYGLYVKSGTGNASLTIENASVDATSSVSYLSYADVCVGSSDSATAPALSLAVNGGSLSTSGIASGEGIKFYVGASGAASATTSLSVTNNAIVDARNGGISASGVNITPELNIGSTDSTGGIVFDGKSGTVYGDVTLDESLTIAQGETLTIPEGSTLNTNGKLTNSGTINVENGGTLNGKPTGTVVYAPVITTQPESKTVTVGQTATFTVAADGTSPTYQWQYSTDGKNWTNIPGATSNSYTTDTTALNMNGYQYQCVVSNTAGKVTSSAATLTVQSIPVDSVTLNKTRLDLVVDGTATLEATIAPENATNQDVTWSSDAETVATVTQDTTDGTKATVTAKTPGTATITVTTNDGNLTATCTVNVTAKTYQISIDQPTLDFGSMFAGNSVPGAQTVNVKNTGNQNVTVALPASTYYNVTAGTGFTDGNAVIEPGKTATFTVQPKTGLAADTYQETLTVSGGNGVQAALLCKLTVTAKTYSMSIDPGAIGFGNVQVGYDQPAVKEVVVKNTGNQTLTLTQPTANNYQLGSLNQFTVAPGDTAIFTVQPKAGLLTGTYNETVVVAASGAQSVSVSLTFSVGSPVTSGTATTEKRTLHFDTNGGLPLDDVVRGLGAPVELWPYTPVRAGYLFQGWYSDQALTKAVSSVVLTKDTTIYAKWAVDPAAAAAAQSSSAASGSGSSGTGSGSGSSGKGSGSTTITVTPSPTVTPTPAPTATPTPEPTATPESSAEPETDADAASFPVVPVAAGVIVLVVLVGGIVIFRRFRD